MKNEIIKIHTQDNELSSLMNAIITIIVGAIAIIGVVDMASPLF